MRRFAFERIARSAVLLMIGALLLATSELGAAVAESPWQSIRVEVSGKPVSLQGVSTFRSDARGRLWMLEAVQDGASLFSRILIVSPDPNHSEKPWSSKVFADHLPVATGLEWSPGGIILAAPPHLLLVPDADRDDHGEESKILCEGLGNLAAGDAVTELRWGPDGWLYMLYSSRNRATLRPAGKGLSPVTVNPGVLRFHLRSGVIEPYADGPVSPRGLAFDSLGRLLVSSASAGGIYQIVPGATYTPVDAYPRPLNPYGFHGPSVAEASLSRVRPGGLRLFGRGEVGESGSPLGFLAVSNEPSPLRLFLQPSRGSVMATRAPWDPADQWALSLQPQLSEETIDGSIVTLKGGVLMQHAGFGKPTGDGSGPLWDSRSIAGWLEGLSSPRPGVRAWSRRLLQDAHDPSAVEPLVKRWATENREGARLDLLWTLGSLAPGNQEWLSRAVIDRSPMVRAHAVRILGERGTVSVPGTQILALRARDAEPVVRWEVALALRRWMLAGRPDDGHLKAPADLEPFLTVLEPLIQAGALAPRSAADEALWGAFEPLVISDFKTAFGLIRKVGDAAMPLSGEMLSRGVRRVFGSRDSAEVAWVLDFLGDLAGDSPSLCVQGLEGVMLGQKASKMWTGHKGIKRLLARLAEGGNPELEKAAQQVDALCGNPAAQNAILARILDKTASVEDRAKAMQFARSVPSDAARDALLNAFVSEDSAGLSATALGALREIGRAQEGKELINRWAKLSGDHRGFAADAMASKTDWVLALVEGLESGKVRRGDLSSTALDSLKNLASPVLRARAQSALASGKE